MIKRWLAALSLLCFSLLAAAPAAHAFDLFPVKCEGAASSSAVCNDPKGDPLTGNDGLLVKITTIIAIIAGAIAIVVLVKGGIDFIASGGDAQNVKNARNTILNALIGLAIIALARTLIVFVVERL